MVERSFDPSVMREATKDHRDMVPDHIIEWWLNDHKHHMYVEDGNVGLATHEYPGLYTMHWYFPTARGRAAITLARRMIDALFKNSDAQTLRGLVKCSLKASRWGARQVGMKSYGIIEFPDGDNEIFCMTKDEFYKEVMNNG